MKKHKTSLYISVLVIFALILISQYTLLSQNKNNIEELENKISNLKNIEIQPEMTFTNVNSEIKQRDFSLKCIAATIGYMGEPDIINYTGLENLPPTKDIIINGKEYLETKDHYLYSRIYDGLQCNLEKGWILMSGKNSEYGIENIEGQERITDWSFIEANGMYSRKGDVTIICCKVE
ncbi:MAG: hypothetical protein V1888_02225 [archaeon]